MMKKTVSLAAALMMICTVLCCSAAAESDAEEFYRNGIDMIWITDPARFSEGLAWIWYHNSTSESMKNVSLIDTGGHFVYTPMDDVSYVSDFHDGTAYYTIMDPNLLQQPINQSDVLIDNMGYEIYRTEGDEYSAVKWERICGYANGVYILVRSVSGMTEEAVEIALMRPDGTMAMDYTHDFKPARSDSYLEPGNPFSGVRHSRDVGYAGKGWYWIENMLFNVETRQVYPFSGRVYTDFDHAGVLVLEAGPTMWMLDENMNYIGPVHWIYSCPDREVFRTDNMYYSSDRCYYDIDNQNVIISLADRYPNNQIKCTPFYGGDYALMEIEGKDGHTYLTMIDRQGREMFSPVMVRAYIPQVMDGYAIAAPDIPGEENNDPVYMILDSSGTFCHSVTEDFGGREIIIKSSFSGEPDYLYSDGWLMLRYKDSSGRWFRFYPLLYAAELGPDKYDVVFPE